MVERGTLHRERRDRDEVDYQERQVCLGFIFKQTSQFLDVTLMELYCLATTFSSSSLIQPFFSRQRQFNQTYGSPRTLERKAIFFSWNELSRRECSIIVKSRVGNSFAHLCKHIYLLISSKRVLCRKHRNKQKIGRRKMFTSVANSFGISTIILPCNI